MHELLAPLYHAAAHDAIMEERGINILADTTLKELCSSIWVAADAWAMFEVVMRGVSRWYEWQEPSSGLPTGASTPKDSPLAAHVRLDVGEGEIRPYVTPIVQACNVIQGTMLRATDPQLFKSIQATGLEPQIYGMYASFIIQSIKALTSFAVDG
jgi:TBC1 domain family protein 5